MSDSLSEIFDTARAQRPPAPFDPPEAIRRRGRQRAHRQAFTAGVAVFAVVGVGVGSAWLLGPDGSPAAPGAHPSGSVHSTSALPVSPSVSTRSSPAAVATAIAPGLFLRPAELGAGTWQEQQPHEPYQGDLWYWADLCPAYRTADYPSLRHQVATDVTGWVDRDSGQPPTQTRISEYLELYTPGWGTRNFNDVRAVLAGCGAIPAPPVPPGGAIPPTAAGGGAPKRMFTVGSGFAGHESVLIRIEQWYYDGEALARQPLLHHVAVVRVNDLVATIVLPDGLLDDYARDIATKAATHMGS